MQPEALAQKIITHSMKIQALRCLHTFGYLVSQPGHLTIFTFEFAVSFALTLFTHVKFNIASTNISITTRIRLLVALVLAVIFTIKCSH